MKPESELTNEEYPLTPADPQEIPEPTYWPITLAFGSLFLFWGLITTPIISVVGLLISGLAIAGWIIELNHEK